MILISTKEPFMLSRRREGTREWFPSLPRSFPPSNSTSAIPTTPTTLTSSNPIQETATSPQNLPKKWFLRQARKQASTISPRTRSAIPMQPISSNKGQTSTTSNTSWVMRPRQTKHTIAYPLPLSNTSAPPSIPSDNTRKHLPLIPHTNTK